jgi:hypothetical protein
MLNLLEKAARFPESTATRALPSRIPSTCHGIFCLRIDTTSFVELYMLQMVSFCVSDRLW